MTDHLNRADLIARLAARIAGQRADGVLRVAIDGPDAAGKTTLAAELAGALAGVREPIALSVDGFHRPRDVRRRRGELSPDGYYADCFDYPAVLEEVLTPLGAKGDRSYREAVFDYRRDVPLELPRRRAPAGAVLLFEGVFLLRPELRDHWDLRVYLHISPAESLRRALVRDADLFGGADATRERYRLRYLPGQELYRRMADPLARADVVVDNEDPAHPRALTWRG